MTVISRLFGRDSSPDAANKDTAASAAEVDNQSTDPAAELGARTTTTDKLDVDALMSDAALSVDATMLEQAIAAIDDPTALSKLAIEGPSTAVRQLAAQAIHDPDQLRDLLKDVRGKDKSVYKIIREKCDALLAVEKAAAETQSTIAAVCAALERHVYVPFDNLYEPALEHFIGRWNAVASQADSEMQARASKALARCQEIVAEHARSKEEEATRAAAVASADADRQSVLADLRCMLASLSSQVTDEASHESQTAALKARWSELARYKPASQSDQSTYVQLGKASDDLASLSAQHGTVAQLAEHISSATPDDASAAKSIDAKAKVLRRMLDAASLLGDEAPEVVNEARTALQAWEQARKDKHDADANALRQLGGLIRKASGALNAGNTRLASGLRRAVEEKLPSVPNVPPHLTSQLQQLDEKLNVLQDWRSYAVAPKRIELIEHMEALVGMDESPQALADQIKRLQDEWKVISKGNTDDTDAEWQRFHQAANKAYEPCKEFFAAQAKQREGNLNKRKALLDRLSQFVAAQDWQTTDWREVARALRESTQQWRNHKQVERAANKPLQARFDELTRELESRLEAESASNAEAKRTLITRAKALLENEDSRQAIDGIKQLQAKWTSIGIVAREDDQKLWAEFRQQCDAVFARRQQQHTEYVSSLGDAKRKAIALCEEAEQVLTLSGPELIEGTKKLSALSELFAAIGELPKADARALQNRFDRALNQCEKAVAAQRNRDKAQAWNTVLDAGDKIRAYRLAVMQGGDSESAKQAALTFIEGVAHWPKGALQIVKAELDKPGSSDIAANESALRTLCIRAEILTETATPEADQQLRRNYQLQRLMKGLGQAPSSKQEELNAMVFEWIAVGATTDAVYAELLERFSRCRSRA